MKNKPRISAALDLSDDIVSHVIVGGFSFNVNRSSYAIEELPAGYLAVTLADGRDLLVHEDQAAFLLKYHDTPTGRREA